MTMPAEATKFEPPGVEWPKTGELIRIFSRKPTEEFEVIGYTETEGGDTAAVLKKGQEGITGLYRLIIIDDWSVNHGDAVIQYHQPEYSGGKGIEHEPSRKWSNHARLEDFFCVADGGEGYEVV